MNRLNTAITAMVMEGKSLYFPSIWEIIVSAALLAMGYSESEALSVVRLSYDQNLGDEAMRLVVEAIASASARLA